MSTFLDVVRGGQAVKKSQDDEDRYYTPIDAMKGQPSGGYWTRLVWEGVKRKVQERQRSERRGERILDRQPTFQDFVVNLSQGLETRQADAFDEAVKSEFDEELAIADLLDGLDSLAESEKSARPTWQEMAQPGYIEKALANK